MILLLSTFVTSNRYCAWNENRYSRIDIFKYMLYSYRNLPFTEIYLFILLDNEFIHLKDDLTKYIYDNFQNLSYDKIHIVHDRYTEQIKWAPFITSLVEKHGTSELVWFMQNDDHIFVDFNMDILNEGIELLKVEKSENKSLAISHWPEAIKFAMNHNPVLISNYLKVNHMLAEGMHIFSLNMLRCIFVDYKWNNSYMRIDNIVIHGNPYSHVMYLPLRELVRHFDGYDHVQMDRTACPLLELPSNTFYYSKELILKKINAFHVSPNNKSNIVPQEWIDINISLHNNILEYTI